MVSGDEDWSTKDWMRLPSATAMTIFAVAARHIRGWIIHVDLRKWRIMARWRLGLGAGDL